MRRKRSAKVYTLPGVERRDLSFAPPAQRVLEGAIARGLTEVALVGVDRTGRLYVAASHQNSDAAAGVLMRGVWTIAGHEIAGPDGDRPPDVVA